MGDSRAMPEFGVVDLDIEDEPNATARPPPSGRSTSEDAGDDLESAAPPSTSRVFNTSKNGSVHDQHTRVVEGDALAALTKSRSARASVARSPLADDGNTRAWADVDEALFSVGRHDDAAPLSSRSSSANAASPSGSGVATRSARVAAMRELYAKGDADGALAVAETLEQSEPPPGGADYPDASIVVEFGEESLDLNDPFGGLIPENDELASTPTAGPPPMDASVTAPPPAMVTAPSPAANLTLTERQSIPRILRSMAEVSKLKIDHRAGFLLAHVDGMQTLEEILDICAMPPAEALELIANLKEMGVIDFE